MDKNENRTVQYSMDHQSQLEKSKYRNWVKGGLAYKYLKEGIEDFADEVVIKEQNRILKAINHTPGLTCNRCYLRNLKPLHKSIKNLNTGKYVCPWSQTNCNCLFPKKRPCPKKVCDAILEEILKSHGSQPPTPNWKNTDIQKWCSSPWEIAKCFINAAGYSDKTAAADIDAPGLLHVFINNINLHTSIACKITGTDVFNRVRQRRNDIFHSPTMELEDREMIDLTDDVIEILEDEKELKKKRDAKQAVEKLRHLKRDGFIITTHNEVEVCRAAMGSIAMKSEELLQAIEETKSYIDSKNTQVKQVADNAKADIDTKENQVLRVIDDKTEQAKNELEKQNDRQLQEMEQTSKILYERVGKLELDNTVTKQRLTEVENNVKRLHETRIVHQKQLEYVEQKQACQKKLVELYQTDYVKTSVSPLKVQDNNIGIDEVYVTPYMSEEKKQQKSRTEEGDMKSKTATNKHDESNEKLINLYSDIFHTCNLTHKMIYILGDVGTGKSSFGKMMIYNWCRAVTESSEDESASTHTNSNATTSSDEANDIHELRRFSLLFFIPLQTMSGQRKCSLAEMIKTYYKDHISSELLMRILREEPERCLVIADGLDEWVPPEEAFYPQHVSHGMPQGIKDATIITLSRPSAKGILNMKSTECDRKIMLHGLYTELVNAFINKYLSKQHGNKKSMDDFLEKIKKNNLGHLEKTPLFLQQLIWMYSTGHDIGRSVSDIYSSIINSMFGWFESKGDLVGITEDMSLIPEKYQQMQLPEPLNRFPRCRANKRFLFLMGSIAFTAFTTNITSGMFGLSNLLDSGLTRSDINGLKSFGILVEYNSNDPTYENTYFSFIHVSYLEFFAAVYISSQNMHATVLEELFKKYKRTADILQLSNLLKLVCGLSPFLLVDISKLVWITVKNDEIMVKYRTSLCEYRLHDTDARQIQGLIYNCLCESGTDDIHFVSLCDIVIDTQFDFSFLRAIIPGSLLSLYCFLPDDYMYAEISKMSIQLSRLQYIWVNGYFIKSVSHYLLSQLASSLQQAVSVKHLTLNGMKCSSPDCNGHTIDLSKHTQLHRINVDTSVFRVGFLGNTKCLENVRISYPSYLNVTMQHDMLVRFSSSLANAASLKHLILKHMICSSQDCNGHTFDLPKHIQLRSIHLKHCSFQIGFLGNTEQLETVTISACPPSVQHDVRDNFTSQQLKSFLKARNKLALSLTQAVSIKHLTLKRIRCYCGNDKTHSVDMSKHGQLQSLRLYDISRCIFVVKIRTVEDLCTRPSDILELPQILCNMSKLKYVKIGAVYFDNERYTIQMNNAVQNLHQVEVLTLKDLIITGNVLMITPRMNNLKKIKIEYVAMNYETFCTFVDSLLILKQSVQVDTQLLVGEEENMFASLEYIRQNKKFEVIDGGKFDFKFKTAPK